MKDKQLDKNQRQCAFCPSCGSNKLRWRGGRSHLCHECFELIPSHRLIIFTYSRDFLGGKVVRTNTY